MGHERELWKNWSRLSERLQEGWPHYSGFWEDGIAKWKAVKFKGRLLQVPKLFQHWKNRKEVKAWLGLCPCCKREANTLTQAMGHSHSHPCASAHFIPQPETASWSLWVPLSFQICSSLPFPRPLLPLHPGITKLVNSFLLFFHSHLYLCPRGCAESWEDSGTERTSWSLPHRSYVAKDKLCNCSKHQFHCMKIWNIIIVINFWAHMCQELCREL